MSILTKQSLLLQKLILQKRFGKTPKSQGGRVVVEHVKDWANGVTVDRQVQEETVTHEQELVQKEVKPSHYEAVSKGML